MPGLAKINRFNQLYGQDIVFQAELVGNSDLEGVTLEFRDVGEKAYSINLLLGGFVSHFRGLKEEKPEENSRFRLLPILLPPSYVFSTGKQV